MTNLPRSRQSDIVQQELETEILIYDLKTNKAFCLNESSAMIWQLCDGNHSTAQISQTLTKKLNQPISEELIWLALDQFKRDRLLENHDKFEIDFKGLNRRQLIKKVGLASMIALPVISSVLAPSALMAQSGGCINPGGSPAGTHLGGAGGSGFCTTPGAADGACTTVRGNLCCSGMAVATGGCFQAGPGCCLGTFSVDCYCA